eukprot:scaffold93058_cov22-Tisochrysis_lutea.AAC.1
MAITFQSTTVNMLISKHNRCAADMYAFQPTQQINTHNAMMVDRQHGGHVREEADENYVALVGSEQGLGQDARCNGKDARVAHLQQDTAKSQSKRLLASSASRAQSTRVSNCASNALEAAGPLLHPHLWRHQELAGCPIQQLLVEPGVIGSRPIPQGVPPKTADQLQSIPGDLRMVPTRVLTHGLCGASP